MTNILKYSLLLGCMMFMVSTTFAQNKDSVTAEILDILTLLEAHEKDEIVMHAHSQRDIPQDEELAWLLENMSDSAKTRVLLYIKRKAGSRIKPKAGTAEIYWLESSYDFGTIREGKVVTYKFEFENIGDVAYNIKEVEGSCGCTIADYSSNAVPPGGKGFILVKFNTKGKKGDNTEFVTVVGNSQPEHVSLIIEAKVY